MARSGVVIFSSPQIFPRAYLQEQIMYTIVRVGAICSA
jgi:hypothetical protein